MTKLLGWLPDIPFSELKNDASNKTNEYSFTYVEEFREPNFINFCVEEKIDDYFSGFAPNLDAHTDSLYDLLLSNGFSHPKTKFLQDTYLDDKQFSFSKNSIWNKIRQTGINEKPKKVISKATFLNEDSKALEVTPLNELTDDCKKQIQNLTPFAKISFFRLKFNNKEQQIHAHVDFCLMPDNKWYSFFQLKRKSVPLPPKFINLPTLLKNDFNASKPARSKIILYLLILYKMQEEERSSYLQHNSLFNEIHFKKTVEELFQKLSIEPSNISKFSNQHSEKNLFFDLCGKKCPPILKFKIEGDTEFQELAPFDQLMKNFPKPLWCNYRAGVPLPFNVRNRPTDINNQDDFVFSLNQAEKIREMHLIGQALTSESYYGLPRFFEYNLRMGVSLLLYTSLVEGDSCYLIHDLIKEKKIEVQTEEASGEDYWMDLAFKKRSLFALCEQRWYD